jgi:hypothetical protein
MWLQSRDYNYMAGSLSSVVLLVPAAQVDVGNKALAAMGEANTGAASFSVPLSPTGTGPATHYGLHTWVPTAWVTKMQNAKAGTIPGGMPWASQGINANAVREMAATLLISTRPDGAHEGHFDQALAANGLQRIVTPRVPA